MHCVYAIYETQFGYHDGRGEVDTVTIIGGYGTYEVVTTTCLCNV